MNHRRSQTKQRPAGVSRRRKKQLGFESLEDRRVMSAESPWAQIVAQLNHNSQLEVTSYSSATPEGQAAQWLSELYWQSIASGAGAPMGSAPRAIPIDPLLNMQWHLINSGQQVGSPDFQAIFGVPGEDINVAPVWNRNIFGNGVVVAIIDSGVETDHPDLVGNIDPDRQLNAQTLLPNGNPTLPQVNPLAAHGTAVAGLIGAVANNGIGGTGVAPGVTLVPIAGAALGPAVVNAIRYAMNNGVDIANHSYGPTDAIRTLAGPTAAELLALRDSVIFGRDGLGLIHIWAAGNGAGDYSARPGFPGVGVFDSSNYDGYANSRYTIAVTGVDHDGSYNNVDGTVTNYMEAGANVLVAAPTGSAFLLVGLDNGVGSGLTTTDITGEFGLNGPPNEQTGEETDRDFLADDDYTSRFNGSSGAAPIVAGVVALMLEANPNLSWRDVKEILVRSARQNDQFGVPTTGAGGFTQSSWIINQVPIFHDPDNPGLGVGTLPVYTPLLDPNQVVFLNAGFDARFYSDHHVASPFAMTNGAGYTVSQGGGPYGEQIGYGHGVVDAELAVLMAEQWHVKNQALPSELTYTTFVQGPGNVPLDLPGAEVGNMASGFLAVPGGIGGEGGFIGYFNEFFADDPDFTQDFEFRGQSSLQFSVPANNTMTIESIDVKLSITGDAASVQDHLRVMLVSPEGTSSELNNFRVPVLAPTFTTQFLPFTDAVALFGEPGSAPPAGQFVWTFNTNRSWGERSDDAILFDPVTGEPVVDQIGIFGDPTLPATLGEALTTGWHLVVENWADVDLGLQGVEIAWHGSPIAANSQRVQGFVGVDDNRDDLFNFSRVVTTDLGVPGATRRLGDVLATPDLTQESFGANVTVSVRRASDNVIVDQFVTGHDGNFYFDLVPDDYIVSIDDPSGRSAIDDTLTPDGLLDHYRSEWTITEDYFRVWDHDPLFPQEVLTDANGDPLPWLDSTPLTQPVTYGMKGINFLLDPGAPAPQQATFTGTIFADVNADGVYNGDDINMPSVIVYGDINRNGQRDPGEITVQTDAMGQYTLVVPVTQGTVMSVGVVRPTNWTSTNDGPGTEDSKTDGLETFFVQPGSVINNVGFSIAPPANNIGGGGATLPGFLLGVVYEDANNNQTRQAGELGATNMTVFIDANNSGVVDLGDSVTTTNEHGAFIFANVTPGQKLIRLIVPSPLVQTTPAPGTGRIVTLTGSSTISNIQFGIRNTATVDFGDLPAIYGATTAAQNGARHTKSAYWLGPTIDFELEGKPSAAADGDDTFAPFDDEDGITFGTIVPGATATLTATASRANGVLQGWVDWNNDGDFNDVGERIFDNVGLGAGANTLTFSVPAGVTVSQVYARFRYGENKIGPGGVIRPIGTPFGLATLGEVEDYLLDVAVPAVPATVGLTGDADSDGDVDGADFLNWQRNVGRTNATKAQGDANGDQRVDRVDLNRVAANFGATTAAAQPAVAASADFDSDGDVDGADFLALQRGLGLGNPSNGAGDANRDGVVNTIDVGLWKQNYAHLTPGTTAAASFVFSASATASSDVAASESRSFGLRRDGATAAAIAASVDAAVTEHDGLFAEFARRPFSDLTGGLLETDRVYRGRVTSADDVSEDAAESGQMASTVAAVDYLRQDRAFADLFGSRRRQGLRAELAWDAADETDVDCDEALALLADHMEVPQD